MERSDKDEILAAIGLVAVKVDRIEADVAGLKADVAVLQSGQDELRRVVAGNHLKIIGRIDELRDQLHKHVCDPQAHKPAA